MQVKCKLGIVLAALLAPLSGLAQNRCSNGIRIEGTVTDPAGAIIPGANVQSSDGEKTATDARGQYRLPCAPLGTVNVRIEAQGFDPKTARVTTQAGLVAHANMQLVIATVTTDVEVRDDASGMDSDRGTGTTVLGSKEVRQLADDPDDFLRQLQVIASEAGGDPASAIITVNGFQNASALPPKSSIASIRVNPDLFSSEYQWAPFGGGLIEIFTKPGADSFHGALFFTDSNGVFNATDPFSVTATPAGKQRYGFELSGPIVSKKSGFSLALEKRDIDEFNVVNAVTLDANGDPAPKQQTIAAPQRLWIASARGDWQATPKDVATLSFSSNVNNLGDQGIGGLTLAPAGFSSAVSEYDLRFSNTLTPNANLLHETRIGYSWKRTGQTPLSSSPALQVAGYFNGGGATSQNLNDREDDLETDDDAMIIRGKHTLTFGAQSLGIFVHDYDPNNFNGAYVFGGGSAPVLDANNNPTGQTTTITALEQYRRALLNLPGGTPTTSQLTSGTPLIPLTQWRLGLFAQDTIKLTSQLTLDAGLRYQLETTPNSFTNFDPRLSIAWSPDKKQTWLFHLRAGLFNNSPTEASDATEVYRLNGTRQQQTTIYSPNYSDPFVPSASSIAVSTIKQFSPSMNQQSTLAVYVSAEHDFPHHWHPRINLYFGDDWNMIRVKNVNAPMVASSVGVAPDPTAALLAPRPIAPNENILQYQSSGHSLGNVVSFNLDQHSYNWLGLSFRYAHYNFKCDAGETDLNPQSSYSNLGESAHVDWLRENRVSFSGNLTLPFKIELATEFDAGDGVPYNITTGTDNNGDGDFNDRPSYASVPGPGVYSTRFGLLTTNTVNGNVPRNLGTMPGPIHLDMDLSRTFKLNPRDKSKDKDKEQTRTLTFNVRSANLLNHTNVTAVNTILSSSVVGQPVSAEAARRVELGIRVSF
jgi:Carboxypeptidase regulatory-like domain/TonB dependent receptor